MQSVEFMKKKINDFKVNYELMIGRDRFRKSSKTTSIYLTTDNAHGVMAHYMDTNWMNFFQYSHYAATLSYFLNNTIFIST